jgi:hypothetical protein
MGSVRVVVATTTLTSDSAKNPDRRQDTRARIPVLLVAGLLAPKSEGWWNRFTFLWHFDDDLVPELLLKEINQWIPVAYG